ncbi:hypothetical protein [Caballeronia sp. CLC5]|uniref:hypothetical protein n=1 Tax=Caballeronia sp. CLC5 TaxID=2906764 RepID=UPI001F2AEB2A|nr:hypothetical protein [Caballeronia sp. CLC5]MCE4570470.1 hypothetical protein [Caballeronia sp. CLC5]
MTAMLAERMLNLVPRDYEIVEREDVGLTALIATRPQRMDAEGFRNVLIFPGGVTVSWASPIVSEMCKKVRRAMAPSGSTYAWQGVPSSLLHQLDHSKSNQEAAPYQSALREWCVLKAFFRGTKSDL